jgi:EF-P beta-lysylation protein EpmB
MNAHLSHQPHVPTWQTELGNAFTNFRDLLEFLNLPLENQPFSELANRGFNMRVPRGYAECMEKGNPDDPLLKQVLPISDELNNFPGFIDDPVGDLDAAKPGGIIHKYHGRVLLITTGGCAIHCRYCFRRNFPYADLQMNKTRLFEALQYIRDNTDISEVILSGGDPLLLSDKRLAQLFQEISQFQHIKRIRIHSRIPIVLPGRITPQLLEIIACIPQQIIMVLHCNHSNEISQKVSDACLKLKQHQIHLFNQTVLLKGVNDQIDPLVQLSEKLFANDIIPYYLHLLDKANGTGHFEVAETTAISIMNGIKTKLPGYLVPKLVRETVGAASKTGVCF